MRATTAVGRLALQVSNNTLLLLSLHYQHVAYVWPQTFRRFETGRLALCRIMVVPTLCLGYDMNDNNNNGTTNGIDDN